MTRLLSHLKRSDIINKVFPGGSLLKRTSLANMSADNEHLLRQFKACIPELTHDKHKGQAGRIGIVGGCEEYTGAPYFAAIAAMKSGADLAHVFCHSKASQVIKAYSPELIVHPILDDTHVMSRFNQWLPRLHSLVVGPGLGRDANSFNTVGAIIHAAKMKNLPMVIDADGLFIVTLDHSLVKGYSKAILTPNAMEFERLYEAVAGVKPVSDNITRHVKELSEELGVTIVRKGHEDIITDGSYVHVCNTKGSPRRCGGQGDLLSGALGLFAFWAHEAKVKSVSTIQQVQGIKQEAGIKQEPGINTDNVSIHNCNPTLLASYAACVLTKICADRAFNKYHRSTLTNDLVAEIPDAFHNLFTDSQNSSFYDV